MATIKEHIQALYRKVEKSLLYTPSEKDVQDAVESYLTSDEGSGWFDAAFKYDAALKSRIGPDGNRDQAEAQALTYQGLHAVALHSKAHALYKNGDFLEARRQSQGARRITGGIEIHPGAQIGKNCFIDHGTGTIIGETAEIGDNCFIYHGVTLGATDGASLEKGEARADGTKRRHPKLLNNVEIGNGVQILGSVTIGNKVKIGAGATIIGNGITIADGTVIDARADIRHSITDKDQFTPGSIPYIPGVTSKKDAVPIIVPKDNRPTTQVEVQGMEWYQTLVSGLQKMLGAPSQA